MMNSAGDLLFVPSEIPHQVENELDSVALSGNFIDANNLQRYVSSYFNDKTLACLTFSLWRLVLEPSCGSV